MSKTYISAELRKLVRERARECREYCLIHQDDAYFGCEVDHIVSEKHGGKTEANNLAYACLFRNRYKGSDLGSLAGKNLVRFFNPRTDNWSDHFYIEGAYIRFLTTIGEVTERISAFRASRTDEAQKIPSLSVKLANQGCNLKESPNATLWLEPLHPNSINILVNARLYTLFYICYAFHPEKPEAKNLRFT
jgi:HNH endonuclease